MVVFRATPGTGMDEQGIARGAVEGGLIDVDALLGRKRPVAPERYELVREIGRGGCGVVYLARDRELERPVAIKYLLEGGAAELERFRREARFIARLRSPAVIEVHELGEIEGWPFIVMRYADGGSLARASPDPRALAAIVRKVALALQEAHEQGIVHRDIKPENVLLDAQGRPYVTDFGIARDISRGGGTLSRKGQILGTPALMPPEQARGDLRAIDGRSDVYSLGATMFLKLTGRHLFEAENVVDLLHAVIHEEAPLLRSVDASLPGELEAIVCRCLEKARDDRYPSMRELAADLASFLEGSAPSSQSPWFRRLVGKLVGAPAEPQPEEPFDRQGLEVVRDLAAWDADIYRVSGSLERSFERLDALQARLEAILAGRPETAWARFYRGAVLARRGRLTEALEEMERSIGRVADAASAHFELGRVYLAAFLEEERRARAHLSPLGMEFDITHARGRLHQAVLCLQEAERAGGELPAWTQDYARAVVRLADGELEGCVAWCEAILADEPDLEEVWKLRGDALTLLGRDPFESYERALDVRRSYFEALYALAEARLARGEIEEARRALERAVRIHPGFVRALALSARTYLEGAADAAELRQGLEIARRAREVDGTCYDAVVACAEIELALAGAEGEGGDPKSFERALRTLEVAKGLPGCQNRVELLAARARLGRALAGAPDGERELEEVEARCSEALRNDPDRETWKDLVRRVRAERSRRSRAGSGRDAPGGT